MTVTITSSITTSNMIKSDSAIRSEHGCIIVSAGMESAGSGWYFSLTNDLLIASGQTCIRELRDQYKLHDMLHHQNCANQDLSSDDMLRMKLVANDGHTFVFKTHKRPRRAVRQLIDNGHVKATYIYRDPRDAVISAYERGKKRRSRGKSGAFARLKTINRTILWMRWLQLPRFDAWRKCPSTMLVRYEDLVENPLEEAKRLVEFLEIEVDNAKIAKIVESYHGDKAKEKKGSHYRSGTGRRRDALNEKQLNKCNRVFGRHLKLMGYEELG